MSTNKAQYAQLYKDIGGIELNIPLISHSPQTIERILLPQTIDAIIAKVKEHELSTVNDLIGDVESLVLVHTDGTREHQGMYVPLKALTDLRSKIKKA